MYQVAPAFRFALTRLGVKRILLPMHRQSNEINNFWPNLVEGGQFRVYCSFYIERFIPQQQEGLVRQCPPDLKSGQVFVFYLTFFSFFSPPQRCRRRNLQPKRTPIFAERCMLQQFPRQCYSHNIFQSCIFHPPSSILS